MNIEQRLVNALRAADQVEPSDDLWSRVVHSIEEDRTHRRRVITSVLITAGVAVVLIASGFAALTDGLFGRQVRPAVMEVIETVALVVLVAVLGPAIRRFGRGYANDLWGSTPATVSALLRLLDVAYLLVFGGYILLTVDLDFDPLAVVVAEQMEATALRVGGLLVLMGLLHALTIMVLPVVALISNSTRTGRKLPRWMTVILAVVGVWGAAQLLLLLMGLLIGMAG